MFAPLSLKRLPVHWVPAIRQDGEDRDGADVCELTELDRWGGPRAREQSAAVKNLIPVPNSPSPTSTATDSRSSSPTGRERAMIIWRLATAAARALRIGSGVGRTPGCATCRPGFAENAAWLTLVLTAQDLLAWTQKLCLTGDAQRWEPKRLRYCLLHVAGHCGKSKRTSCDAEAATIVAMGG